MHNKFRSPAVWLLILVSSLGAQQPPAADPLAELLFPPELVMARQNAIGLTEAQKTYLRAEVLKAQTRFTELQWQLQEAMEGLIGLLKQPKADEAQVLVQTDKVLASEREIKLNGAVGSIIHACARASTYTGKSDSPSGLRVIWRRKG